jgi:hypothetical protein
MAAACAHCGKELKTTVSRVVNGAGRNFCSNNCADAFEVKYAGGRERSKFFQALGAQKSKARFSDVVYGYGYLMSKEYMETKVNAAFQELRNTAQSLGVVLPMEIFLYNPKRPKYIENNFINQDGNFSVFGRRKFVRTHLKGVGFDNGLFSFSVKNFGGWTLSLKNLPRMKAAANAKGKDLLTMPWRQYQEEQGNMDGDRVWFNKARLDRLVKKRLDKKFMDSGYDPSTGHFYFVSCRHDKVPVSHDQVEYYKFSARGSLIESNPTPPIPEAGIWPRKDV